jgi:Tol biopolymer transport system component
VGSGGIVWSPDGSRVLYRADEDTPDVVALYSVRPDGTARLCVSGAPASGWQVLAGFAWSPDGVHIAYRMGRNAGAIVELWTARADGASPYRITGELAEDWLHSAFSWSVDGTWLAFRTTLNRLITFDPLGRTLSEIDRSVAPGFLWAPDGRHLAYLTTAGVLHTAFAETGHSVPVADSQPDFVWSPGGDAIMFVSDALYTAGIDGGSVSLVSRLAIVGTPLWSPSGDRIAFGARNSNGALQLFVAWPHGGATPIACGESQTIG